MAYLIALLFCVTFVSGMLAFEANQALPGEYLYPYKITVNEWLEDLLARTDSGRGALELQLLHTRFTEALTLARQEQLGVHEQVALAESISTTVAAVKNHIRQLDATGQNSAAAALALGLYQTLKTGADTLSTESSFGTAEKQVSLEPVLVRVRTSLAAAELLSMQVQAQVAFAE